MAIKRGCGERVAGGVYMSTFLGDRGHPLDCFLQDPPRPVDAPALGLRPIGVSLLEGEGDVTHVLDWVGADSYPYVADFVEETRRHGLSRRITQGAEFARLGPASKIMLLHSRAILADPTAYFLAIEEGRMHPCPATVSYLHCGRGFGSHVNQDVMCGGYWWHDIPADDLNDYHAERREGVRVIGSTRYTAGARPAALQGVWALGIFLILPIHALEVVRDPEGGTHERAVERAMGARLPVCVVDE